MKLNNRTPAPAPSVNLVVEDKEQSTQVFSTKRLIRGKEHKEFRVIIKNGPRFTIDSADKLGTFIRRSKDNKLVGLVKNGEMKRSRVDQIFFLSKLDLMPNLRTNEESDINPNETPEDQECFTSELSVLSSSALSPSSTYHSSSPHPSTSSHGSV